MKSLSTLLLLIFLTLLTPRAFFGKETFSWDKVYAELRFGYFHPTKAIIRDVYEGALQTQINVGLNVYEDLSAYLGTSVFKASGKSLGLAEKTWLRITPLILGIKYPYPLASWSWIYVSGGAKVNFVRVHSDSNFVDPTLNAVGGGGFIETGFWFYLADNLYLDIFTNYNYSPTKFSPEKPSIIGNTVDLGGVYTGGGFHYKF